MNFKNNELIPMTRRYPDLPEKVLRRDSKIVMQIARAWDVEQDAEKVLQLFVKNSQKLSSYRYWELLRSVWIVCGSLENAGMFSLLMKAKKPNKHYFSTPEEHDKLRNMPEEINVYRACNKYNDGGLSWTTSLEYARKYQIDFHRNFINMRKVNKSDVFAYIERNNEFEIILL